MYDKYLDIIEYKQCSGCASCQNICPAGAITMAEDKEGFLYPQVDHEKCTNCGMCKKVCPVLNAKFHEKQAECYAARANEEIQMKSSSGGIFTLLAEKILEKGGYVCGAAFDNDWNVEHIIVDNKEDLAKLRGSKYIQSKIGNIYRDVKNLLEDDKFVFFTGTPCQIAGLYGFLQKDYENLLTADVVCHGVPNSKVWQKYLKENFGDENICKVEFRSKEEGWTCTHLIVTTPDNKIKDSKFMDGFGDNLYLRKSCGECKFAKPERLSDITLGDFWGINVYRPELYNHMGVSVVFTHTQKGKDYLEKISGEIVSLEKIDSALTHYNYPLFHPSRENAFREEFFKQIPEKSFNETYENSYKYCAILNFWWCNNYGAMCTAYALQETVKSLGFAVKTINWIPKWFYDRSYLGGISEKFAAKYFNLTELCHDKTDLKRLNNRVNKFIVGSDQVWRYGVEQLRNWPEFRDYDNNCFLAFADYNKPKLAYAASFACNTYEGNYLNKQLVRVLLNRFQGISVREDSGVTICKEEFDVDATHVLDPVFLPDKSLWENIISDSTRDEKDFICYYVLDNLHGKKDHLEYIKKRYRANEIIDISQNFQISVEDWLYYIKNCKLFIADSFHGCCLAIIFNKPFICMKNVLRGKERFESLFKMLHLENRFVNFDENLDNRDDLFEDINWAEVESILNKNKEFSLQWLKNHLNQEYDLSLDVQGTTNEALMSLADEALQKLNRREIEINHIRNVLNTKPDKSCLYTEVNNLVKYFTDELRDNMGKSPFNNEIIGKVNPDEESALPPPPAIAEMTRVVEDYNVKNAELLRDVALYRKNVLKYWKYKILTNFVTGKTKSRYRLKKRLYKQKVRNVKNFIN